MAIHPTALIEDGARIGQDVKIGPYCVIGRDVVLGDQAELKSHVVLAGNTTIGVRAKIFPFASIGHQPQDLKYHGEPVSLTIGDDCMIREGVTLNPGTEGGGSKTIIGNHCTFLANSHIGHDCIVGNNVVLSNNVMVAGHVSIGDFVILGGGCAIVQFTRIGSHAFVGGMCGLAGDLIPYGIAATGHAGSRAVLSGLNVVGLQRHGFSKDEVRTLRDAYHKIFEGEGTLKDRVQDVTLEYKGQALVQEIVQFIQDAGKRSICMP